MVNQRFFYSFQAFENQLIESILLLYLLNFTSMKNKTSSIASIFLFVSGFFLTACPASENPPPSDNDIEGIYVGIQSALNSRGEIEKKIYYLLVYNDGKLKANQLLPENGLNTFDREADIVKNSGQWADYDLKAGKAVFKDNNNRTVGFSYDKNNKSILYDGAEFFKAPSVDGLLLSETYTADKDPLAVKAFGYEPTIAFSKDGRFEDKKAMYYVKSYDLMFKNPGVGKYSINNFTIDIVYDDGRGKASFPFVNLDATDFSSIIIGDHVMLKK
jgi:hypothetical protein